MFDVLDHEIVWNIEKMSGRTLRAVRIRLTFFAIGDDDTTPLDDNANLGEIVIDSFLVRRQ